MPIEVDIALKVLLSLLVILFIVSISVVLPPVFQSTVELGKSRAFPSHSHYHIAPVLRMANFKPRL